MGGLPRIAIAGLGSIGERTASACIDIGIKPFVYDLKGLPESIEPDSVVQLPSQEAVYSADADIFHLALHPADRKQYLDALLKLSKKLLVVEKPMTLPETPEECEEIARAVDASGVDVLYDFPELFDPMTHRIVEYLSGFEDVEITSMYFDRSKDREDEKIPKNHNKMVPIQYQESIHTIAFILYILGNLNENRNARSVFRDVFSDGVKVCAESEPYSPPNPKAYYPYVVDGKCDFDMAIGDIPIECHTNFKKGPAPKKIVTIEGFADGNPFVIEASYLEGEKELYIDGVNQGFEPGHCSYQDIIRGVTQLYGHPGDGIISNPFFAWTADSLSRAVWKSSFENKFRTDKQGITIHTLDELLSFDADFAGAREEFYRYQPYIPLR